MSMPCAPVTSNGMAGQSNSAQQTGLAKKINTVVVFIGELGDLAVSVEVVKMGLEEV